MKSTTEIMGHIVVHLNVSLSPGTTHTDKVPKDLDLFITLRHFNAQGKEEDFQGPSGGPVVVTKGWLRCSLRKVDESHPYHKFYQPWRNYRKADLEYLKVDKVYTVDVEVWPTNLVLAKGETLVVEVASGDTSVSFSKYYLS